MTKDQLRKEMKQKRDSLLREERSSYNMTIRSLLLQSEEYMECKKLFVYVSFGSEVDTHDIIHRALADQKQVYIPRVHHSYMEFYRIRDLEGLEISKFGVPEPPAMEENRFRKDKYPNQSGDNLMLLPGLAFDRRGNRVGYGSGYYDRYLLEYPKDYFYKIAVAYDFQILDQIESEEHDIRADGIITPKGYEKWI
jgi:5-formyltetrahydrofolate cyclo-ligase